MTAPAARWSERQRAMLDAMGLRPWGPADPAAAPAPVPGATAAPAMPAASGAAGGPPGVPPRASPGPAPGEPGAPPVPVPAVGPPARRAAAAAPGDAPPPAAEAPAAPPVVAVVPGDVASMDWEALERTVAGCVACPLAARRTHTVFGAGGHGAHWMIVSEAPGEQEDLSGEPFVGASGRLLDRMLAALGLARDAAEPERQVYIANTVKCRPPRNRNPEPAELAACEAYLARQIALVRPRVILALGRVAAHWLLRTDLPLGRLRGRPHRYEGVPLVVTYHPAYLLRQAEDKARAWDDLCLAREVVAREGAGAAAAAPAG